jgi:CO dehydrogenase/acetyl-CoA synthase beta subunit
MGLFDRQHDEITAYLARKRDEGRVTEFSHDGKTDWPLSKNRNLVLGQDTAIELGNPKDASTACLLWVNDPGKVNNGRVTVVGPDIPQLGEQHISFGKVVIVGGKDFNEENSYDRYRAMEHLRYDIHLEGYMMRGVSQYQREWSRISKMAVNNGFSFQVLGGALIDKFFELKYVRAVETIFITSGKDDVLAMKNISDNIAKIINAMNKMAEEMSFDCDSCEYTEVCSDVAELRSMRRSNKSKGAAANA